MFYTDLAVEEQERFAGDGGEIPGVVLEKTREKGAGIVTTKIEILNEEGQQRMGKPMGVYLTLEWDACGREEENSAGIAAKHIQKLLPKGARTFLVAGLGNSDMTADALGPRTAGAVSVTRNVSSSEYKIASIVPGVMAQTGMESSEIVKAIADKIHPDCIIVVDALAARSACRLGNTIQITNTGICPGAGIGNKRCGIREENMGVPVIAIGIPTVVSAAAIVCDAMEALKETYQENRELLGSILGSVADLSGQEYYQLITEVLSPRIGNFFVMPKDLDVRLEQLSAMLAEALELALGQSQEG